jgi:surface antigen
MRCGVLAIAMLVICASAAQARPLAPRLAHFAMLADAGAPDAADLDLSLAALSLPISAPKVLRGAQKLQCAIYARRRSGLSLRGRARTWWTSAKGVYKRAQAPEVGAVLVMGGTRYGHVAVVSDVISPTEILVDHANWMDQGEIEIGALIRDVSPDNSWSKVRVWYPPSRGLGGKAYPVFGFILPQAAAQQVASLNEPL